MDATNRSLGDWVTGAGKVAWRIRNRFAVPLYRRQYKQTHPLGEWKIEIGPGRWPTDGYFHVDTWQWGPHLEAIAKMWALPVPDRAATEVRSIHALEHADGPKLIKTLEEWRRVLVPGGKVHVSVPNGPAIMRAFEKATVAEKWPLMGSILGTYTGPQRQDLSALRSRTDHQFVFDHDVLEWALQQAGFAEVVDLTEQEDDRHSLAWRPMVERYSLIMEAVTPST
jgi:hypothetical protein